MKKHDERINSKPHKRTRGSTGIRQGSAVREILQRTKGSGSPSDSFEREADRNADRIAGRQFDDNSHPARSGRPNSEVMNSKGKGKRLNDSVKRDLEPRFRSKLNQVRIHTDHNAIRLNRKFGSYAFTHGNDIYFNQNQYQPASRSGKWLLAHELTHTMQKGSENILRMYRPADAFNFGKRDTATMKEDSFTESDIDKKPWIKNIDIHFSAKKADDNGYQIQSGRLQASYHSNPVKLADVTADATGGSAELGRTDKVSKTVHRIEGVGYNSGKYSGEYDKENREGPLNRYSKDLAANMSYAIFYNGGEAIHAGVLSLSSHGCVHVEDWSTIRQLNYHSVIGKTKVKVTED